MVKAVDQEGMNKIWIGMIIESDVNEDIQR